MGGGGGGEGAAGTADVVVGWGGMRRDGRAHGSTFFLFRSVRRGGWFLCVIVCLGVASAQLLFYTP